MRHELHRWRGRLAAALGATILAGAPAMAQAPGEASAVNIPTCDRACLIDHARDYMKALAAHDAGKAKFADDVQFTENNVVIPIGKGLWNSISKVAPTGLELADPLTGQAGWFGVIWEHDIPAIYAMRIHVTAGKIDEVETVVHRKTGLPAPFGDPDKVEHDPEFNAVLPPEERRSRARLVAVAQSYFNTVERNDGMTFATFSQDCGRLENGISTTAPRSGPGGNASNIAAGCEAQFKLGIYRINKRIRERRFPLVDEERGVVMASGFFDHDNEVDNYKLTNGREMKTALKWPNSISLLEAFRVKNGEIQRIEAVFTYVPYFMHNPWATGPGREEASE
ncbi:hypothetical protein [Sphingobium nicotianae]|uniref:DUF8021 domain-containing protein n=1 Tax=Sphingobium nicotianae TaxID=2782607 RepID=A0A9X1DCM3_9SPHN|nr:hypothetical protein [Sphingobium nicotianae]MBT2187476.1 hypothetical protein [Sphingobium nicotianae]